MVQILDGRIVRDKIEKELKSQIEKLFFERKRDQTKPKLEIIQIGDLPEANTYIAQKIKFGEKIGAIVDHQKLPEDVSEENLKSLIVNLNSNNSVHGIIVQLPIPDRLDKDKIIDTISPQKDVDGQTSANIKLLFENRKEGYTPATTKGILTLLDYYKIPIEGRYVVIVGRSSLVGKPTALAFLNQDATVTICHSKTRNLKQQTRNADILVVASGRPKLITKDHVTKNQVVVDIGINVVNNEQETINQKPETELPARKLVGDVDFDEVSKIVGAITPVPGGIGPMTVASLFQNLLEAYTRQT